ncbi:hypothetical protein Pelo_13541 [Pelomyxa schiedti]|nr:hypothetical protein Pelo_13541 [Pelomyxa schiedti]
MYVCDLQRQTLVEASRAAFGHGAVRRNTDDGTFRVQVPPLTPSEWIFTSLWQALVLLLAIVATTLVAAWLWPLIFQLVLGPAPAPAPLRPGPTASLVPCGPAGGYCTRSGRAASDAYSDRLLPTESPLRPGSYHGGVHEGPGLDSCWGVAEVDGFLVETRCYVCRGAGDDSDGGEGDGNMILICGKLFVWLVMWLLLLIGACCCCGATVVHIKPFRTTYLWAYTFARALRHPLRVSPNSRNCACANFQWGIIFGTPPFCINLGWCSVKGNSAQFGSTVSWSFQALRSIRPSSQ